LTLKFSSNLNEHLKNESFGFNNLDIFYCDSGEECFDNTPDYEDGKNVLRLLRDEENYENDWISNLS